MVRLPCRGGAARLAGRSWRTRGIEAEQQTGSALMVAAGGGPPRWSPGRAGDLPGVQVNVEVGFGVAGGVADRGHLGHQVQSPMAPPRAGYPRRSRPCRPPRWRWLLPGRGGHLVDQGHSPLAVGGVAGPHVQPQDQLGGLVGNEIHLVPVEAAGRGLRPWRIWGSDTPDDPIRARVGGLPLLLLRIETGGRSVGDVAPWWVPDVRPPRRR